eukprot:gnl/MRDRNA2_/MRDRNA2_126489_c0_seq1.p1 gnl/MRDRNA2_/MRDRNA2_126489_c0~~gnl/MRDRNA2_/MRDRNA2_126489_c0_seq1.p1  ORF type:complete len:324 (+),score=43.34 gnl/MRDRNA2_/MRDRNA2_126489_c0_seq1:73-1044(+)
MHGSWGDEPHIPWRDLPRPRDVFQVPGAKKVLQTQTISGDVAYREVSWQAKSSFASDPQQTRGVPVSKRPHSARASKRPQSARAGSARGGRFTPRSTPRHAHGVPTPMTVGAKPDYDLQYARGQPGFDRGGAMDEKELQALINGGQAVRLDGSTISKDHSSAAAVSFPLRYGAPQRDPWAGQTVHVEVELSCTHGDDTATELARRLGELQLAKARAVQEERYEDAAAYVRESKNVRRALDAALAGRSDPPVDPGHGPGPLLSRSEPSPVAENKMHEPAAPPWAPFPIHWTELNRSRAYRLRMDILDAEEAMAKKCGRKMRTNI